MHLYSKLNQVIQFLHLTIFEEKFHLFLYYLMLNEISYLLFLEVNKIHIKILRLFLYDYYLMYYLNIGLLYLVNFFLFFLFLINFLNCLFYYHLLEILIFLIKREILLSLFFLKEFFYLKLIIFDLLFLMNVYLFLFQLNL